ncbi:hypothetical protein [Crenobacter cavernae]|uniref:Uncharacterized protein n=1 Tax=Crenobacter cavernae TaxID=2290923 RepID=A0A345Y8P6_9NEIS|nr:hypothetical protein [Crenobacter cavernae]AXK40298.1 hypothetical protein DWG20_13125 [Crenobacter cavernae]
MKATAIGFLEMKGKSKATGNDYHMVQLNILTENKSANATNMSKIGVGYESFSLAIDESAKAKFMCLTYPCNVDLVLDHRPRGRNLEAVVTGLAGEPVFIDISKRLC